MTPRTSAPLPPFERTLEAHGPAVLRFCAHQAGPAQADDVFQETMIAALRTYPSLRDPGAIRGWLFQIAARKAIDAHRARARRPEPVADPDDVAGVARGPVAPPVPGPEHEDPALWARVRALPEKQRAAVTLRFLGDLTHAEIAVVMETSEDAARRNVFEGLKTLRKDAPA